MATFICLFFPSVSFPLFFVRPCFGLGLAWFRLSCDHDSNKRSDDLALVIKEERHLRKQRLLGGSMFLGS